MSNPAEAYESYLVPAFFMPLSTLVIDAAKPRPGERVLDVACGTGIVARRVAPLIAPAGRATGLDLNPAMLEVADAAALREGVEIDWRQGRAEALSFDDAEFDVVFCQHGLQFVPDRASAVAEMRRVARLGGRIVVSVQQPMEQRPFEVRLDDAFQRRLGSSAIRQIYALSDADELRDLLIDAGLNDVTIEPATFVARYPDPDRYLRLRVESVIAAIPSLQHLDELGRSEVVAAIGEEMREQVRLHTEGGVFIQQHGVYIARSVR